MSLAYFTIQYVADPMRGEGRNVAVIGTTEGRGYLRAVGVHGDGEIDLAAFRAASGQSVEESVTVPDWVEYFRCVAEDDARSPESLARVLGRLSESNGAFVMGAAGETDIGRVEGPERAMDRVFERVVGQPPADRIDRFPDRLHRLLHLSELRALPDFWASAEVELKTPAGTTKLGFDFALVNAPAIGFRVVRWHGAGAKTGRELRAALSEFERAWECRFLSRMRSVLLTDCKWPNGALSEQLARSRLTVIDVMADDALKRLHHLLQRRASGRRV